MLQYVHKSLVLSRIYASIIIGCFVFFFCSCSETRKEQADSNSEIQIDNETKQYDYDVDEPLVIFYQESALLNNFNITHSEIPMETHKIYSNVDGQSVGLDYWVKKYGDPDIILLRKGCGFDLEQEYEEGRIENIEQYVMEDESIVYSNYVPGTFDVMYNGDAMLGLPLSWYKRCLIVQDQKVENSMLATLPENYTGTELFNTLWLELQKNDYYEEFFWTTGFGLLGLLEEMNEFEANADGEFELNEELFELLYKFEITRTDKFNSAKESFGDYSGYMNQYNMNPALEPEMFDGNYLGCSLLGAPQVTAIYAKSVAESNQKGITLYWIPEADKGDEYTGLVVDFALIGGNSARKGQAYEVIRMMMDMKIEIITQPESGVEEIYSPVHIERSLEMLEYFDEQETSLCIMDRSKNPTKTIEKQKLNNEEKQKIIDVITGMTGLYLDIDEERKIALLPIYSSYEAYCFEGGAIDYKSCYYEFMRYLNPESEDWNLSAEELQEYLESDEKKLEAGEEENEEEQSNFDIEAEKIKEEIRNTAVGDIITFGETEQDNNLDNGEEPIEWIILRKEENQVLVISKDVLEYLKFTYFLKKYQEDNTVYEKYDSEFSWESSRNNQLAWLENELYPNGFTDVEKSIILLHENQTIQDNNTYIYQSKEYLYIPTKEEVEEYMGDEEIRRAEASDYVLNKMKEYDNKYVTWSLRNEGYNFLYAMEVTEDGEINTLGHLNKLDNGVRPVMWLDIGRESK